LYLLTNVNIIIHLLQLLLLYITLNYIQTNTL